MPRSASYLEIAGGPNPHDLMVWPNPADPEEVGWRLRHRSVTDDQHRRDVLVATSFMDAYQALIAMPQKLRNQRIQQIRFAAKHAAYRTSRGKDDE